MKPVVCVTEKEYVKVESTFRNSTDFRCIAVGCEEVALAKAVTDNKVLGAVVGVDRYSKHLYSAVPRGGIIARCGVGHDNIDKAKATDAGILVTNTPGVLEESVAELAIWLMGSLARQINIHDAHLKADKWQPSIGTELRGKRLLMLGCGKIGCKVAKIAAFGLGMYVLGYDIAQLNAEEMKNKWGIERIYSSPDDAVGLADFVSVHLPSNEDTRHFVGKVLISKMKKSSYLINTARGSIVDECALYEAIVSGQMEHPDMVGALNKYRTVGRNHNISVGMHIVRPDSENIRTTIEQGYTLIALGLDNVFLDESSKAVLKAAGR